MKVLLCKQAGSPQLLLLLTLLVITFKIEKQKETLSVVREA